MNIRSGAACLVLLLVCAVAAAAPSPYEQAMREAGADATQEALRQRVEQISQGVTDAIAGIPIAARILLPALYEERQFRPFWLDPVRIQALVELVRDSEAEGLDPADYHLAALERIREDPAPSTDPYRLADQDIILTDALARLEHHLRFGKVDPFDLDPHWNFEAEADIGDPLSNLRLALSATSLDTYVRQAFPRGVLYRTLKDALARYRAIEGAGGWPALPDGPTLKAGMRDPRLPILRERLSAEFELEAGTDPGIYDTGLEEVVRRFQRYYGIEVDGAVGPATRASLNVTVGDRIDQIRVNLDRARWVLDRPESQYLVINIAGFHAYLMRHGEIAWESRVVVGTPYRKTPVFRSSMTYLVFNPSWTIPPTILRKDILPEVLADRASLERRQIDVVDGDGRVIDPDTIDWSGYSRAGFPYQLVQRPGPRNALGRVKFIFPNRHFVFLHDTPSRELFNRAGRTFSSGCIRLERPLELADLLLAGSGEWDRVAIEKAVASGQTRTVFLPKPLPVMLLYWTAGFGSSGEFRFHPDVYERDEAVLRALESDFEPRLGPHRSKTGDLAARSG